MTPSPELSPHRLFTPRSQLAVALVGAVVLVLLVLLATVGHSAAHGRDGTMTVITAEAAGPNQIKLEVGIVYANDEDLAESATVAANLKGPGGAAVGPIAVPRLRSAIYAAVLDVPGPGPWSLTIDATEPTASATAQVVVSSGPTPAPVTSVAPSTTRSPATAAPTVTAPATTSSKPAVPAAEPTKGVLIAAALAVVAAMTVAAYFLIRRRAAD